MELTIQHRKTVQCYPQTVQHAANTQHMKRVQCHPQTVWHWPLSLPHSTETLRTAWRRPHIKGKRQCCLQTVWHWPYRSFFQNYITQPHNKCVYSAQKANHRNRLHIQTNHKKAARRVRCYNAQSAHIHYWKILLTLVTMFLGLLSPWGQNHITVLMHSLKVLCQNTGRVVYPYMHATHYKYFVHVHVCNNSIKWAHQNQSKTFTVAVTLTWK